MIVRLSNKLAARLKIPPPEAAPADSNPFADWSAHLFTADRTRYVMMTNTPALYSCVFYGRGLAQQFVGRVLDAIRELMVDDGFELIYQRLVAPTTQTVHFASALNRSVTGSMNDMIYRSQMWLTKGDLSPFDVSFKINEMPMSALDYRTPREAFKALDLVAK
jgi:hypothetical protein